MYLLMQVCSSTILANFFIKNSKVGIFSKYNNVFSNKKSYFSFLSQIYKYFYYDRGDIYYGILNVLI